MFYFVLFKFSSDITWFYSSDADLHTAPKEEKHGVPIFPDRVVSQHFNFFHSQDILNKPRVAKFKTRIHGLHSECPARERRRVLSPIAMAVANNKFKHRTILSCYIFSFDNSTIPLLIKE